MKFLICTFLAVVTTCHAISDPDALKKDIKDFEPLIPKAKIVLVAAKHFLFDSDFKKAYNFLGTPESNALGLNIMKSRPFRAIVDDLNKSGINAVLIINTFSKLLKFPPYPEKFDAEDLIIEPRSLGSFIDEAIATLPKEDIGKLLKQKLRTNPDLKKMYDKVTSAEFQKKVQAILKYPMLAPTFAVFKSNGIVFSDTLKAVNTILSWAK